MENLKTLTRLQRHTAYIILLEEVLANASRMPGLCNAIREVFNVYVYEDVCPGEFKRLFPELYKKKPEGGGDYWFPTCADGWQIRIKLIQQCIEETAHY